MTTHDGGTEMTEAEHIQLWEKELARGNTFRAVAVELEHERLMREARSRAAGQR